MKHTFISMNISRHIWAVWAWLLVLCVLAMPSMGKGLNSQDAHGDREQLSQQRRANSTEDDDKDSTNYVRQHYTKHEYRIPMRDGVHLYTAVYIPKDTSKTYPILMIRTPYSVQPYGVDNVRSSLGPSQLFTKEGYIFVYQDVRGRFMSEGTFVNMRPQLDNKPNRQTIDESSDTYDTIDWLINHVPHHNGRVGMWGISYPGFYAAVGMIDAHPALKAVSPQAPIADWFFDDFHHHGAFFLPHAFGFLAIFGTPRPEPTKKWGERFDYDTPDGYQFFMDLGSLKHVNERYFDDNIDFWNKIAEHPNYDRFWQSRNLLPHLRHVAPAVMVVGGWFDAEDLYGALNIYQAVEKQNPDSFNMLVMGPWRHGGWARDLGEKLGNIHFDAETSVFYRQHIELPFFEYYLKDKHDPTLPEAYVFEVGSNQWRRFDHWPPEHTQSRNLYLHQGGRLAFEPPVTKATFDEYISDPNKPVPYTETITTGMTREYMTDDQRFAARRTDVLAYQTDVLEEDITLAGPIGANLWVSTSNTAADWVVKLIDVFPADVEDREDTPKLKALGGYEMMVRSEVIRGRFRNSYAHPEPFTPDQPTEIKLPLQDVLHTFRRGHRIMVQIQSTWFPLVDRNPQTYVDNVFRAHDDVFKKATHRVYRTTSQASHLTIGILSTP